METHVARQTHPFVIVAAIAVTVFCLVGIGAVLGWIPASIGGGGATHAALAPEQPKAQADAGPLAQAPAQPRAQVDTAKTAAPTSAAKPAKPQPKSVARAEPPQPVVRDFPPPPPVVAATCRECAVIEEVREVEKAGQASGGGAAAGAVVGGVLGHQVGGGRGKDIATVLGAIGGGFAGHQIEKNVRKTMEYQIVVRYEDGTRGLITQDAPPSWRPGDKVKIIDGAIRDRG
jgi:outer membrane lipoprotein SlyB